MADTRDLKSLAVKSVPVRVRPVVPFFGSLKIYCSNEDSRELIFGRISGQSSLEKLRDRAYELIQ